MILAGPNRAANTAVKNERVALYSELDQGALVSRLNEIYGPAWVEWNVTFHQAEVEWDFPTENERTGIFNRNRRFSNPPMNLRSYLLLLGGNYRSGVNYVVLVLRRKNDHHPDNERISFNFGSDQDRWLSVVTIAAEQNNHNHDPIPLTETFWNGRFNTLAHELGHGQRISKHPEGLSGVNNHPFGHPEPDLDPFNLMNYVQELNRVLRKPQWDEANPFLPTDPQPNPSPTE